RGPAGLARRPAHHRFRQVLGFEPATYTGCLKRGTRGQGEGNCWGRDVLLLGQAGGTEVDGPYLRIEDSGEVIPLAEAVTTIGRGSGVDIHLSDPSVSRLHAEIVRRGPYAYVTDLGLSRNGTRVNGRLVARRVLEDGDVLTFGNARCRVFGLMTEELAADVELRRPAAPELTRRELDVVTSL